MRRFPTVIPLLLILAVDSPLPAQYPGGYPPGQGYPLPGSQSPVGGIPIPGRSKGKTTESKTSTVPSHTLTGVIKQIDDGRISIVAKDTRTITAQLSAKTQFLNKGEPTTAVNFSVGDRIRIDATQDDQGYYHAVRVELESKGTTKDRQALEDSAPVSVQKDREDERPILRRKPAPGAAEPAPEEKVAKAEVEQEKEEPAPPRQSPTWVVKDDVDCLDENGSGPPVTRRGKPAPRNPTAASTKKPCVAPAASPEPVEIASANPAPWKTVPSDGSVQPSTNPQEDPVIAKAREAVANYTQSLPNYFCQQHVARFASTSPNNWQPLDVISAVVVLENGKDTYRDIAVNGKPVKKKMEELGGTWSTGEFGMVAADIFSPATAAEFSLRSSTSIAGRDAVIYDFVVELDNSHWLIHAPSQSIRPSYKGSVWLESSTAQVLRIEMMTRRMPKEFPFDKVESAVDYDYVRIGENKFLLPVHAENLTCVRGTPNCTRNVTDFRNYRKYSGESVITFGDSTITYDKQQ